jgi:penicillin-binding protein 1A
MGSRTGSAPPHGGGPSRASALTSRLLLLLAVVGATGLLLGSLALPAALATNDVLVAVRQEVLDVPPLGEADTPPQNSYVYAADGSELAELTFEENRVPVGLDDVPQDAVNAVLATEDADFYAHQGVNHLAIVRAAITNLRAGGIEGGASTITQQYVKQTFLTPEQTLGRKVQEAIYATQLERQLPKDEILERYLNRTYFGSGVYGIGTAADRYFSKPVGELTLGEAATLAGIIRSPERNNPIANLDNAQLRRDIVLGQMATHGFISREQAEAARAEPLEPQISEPPAPAQPFWVDWVSRLLVSEDAAQALGTQVDAFESMGATLEERRATVFQSGLRIHTTLDTEMQEHAEAALREHLSYEDEPPEELAREPMGALVSVEPETGAIRAMALGPHEWGSCLEDGSWVGEGDDGQLLCDKTKVNPAIPGAGSGGRQPGSAFKPFLVAAALEDGLPPTLEMESRGPKDIEGCIDSDVDTTWTVRNFSEGGPAVMDMYEAVKRSSNVYHAMLVADIGPAKLVEVAHKLGIRSRLGENCSLSLGAAEVNPLEMAAAYGTLANRGVRCEPFPIVRIEDAQGRTIWEHSVDCTRVIDTEVADRAVDIMAGPVEPGGTAPGANLGRWPTRGKTGTTNDFRDAWFVGFVKQLSTAAWVGYPAGTRTYATTEAAAAVCGDEDWFEAGAVQCSGETEFLTNVTIGGQQYARVTGGALPAPMWTTYMSQAVQRFEPEAFPEPGPLPSGVVPNLLDAGSISRAERLAEEAGFRLVVRTVSDYRSQGTFVGQDPRPGTEHPLGSRIVLSVSDGTGQRPSVPNVVGMTLDEAVGVLSALGYDVGLRDVNTDDPGLDGRVVATSPGAGTALLPGDGIQVVLSVGRFNAPVEEPADDEVDEEPVEDEDEPDEPEDEDGDDDGDGNGRGRGRSGDAPGRQDD